jgi:hypothetical protein
VEPVSAFSGDKFSGPEKKSANAVLLKEILILIGS